MRKKRGKEKSKEGGLAKNIYLGQDGVVEHGEFATKWVQSLSYRTFLGVANSSTRQQLLATFEPNALMKRVLPDLDHGKTIAPTGV